MGGDNIISIEPKLLARSMRQRDVDRSAANVRVLSRAVQQMRNQGANSKEIANSLRLIADELDGKPSA